jgi:ankyrin repeat protein
MYAIAFNHTEVVEVLLKAGASTLGRGAQALRQACEDGLEGIVGALIAHGLDLDRPMPDSPSKEVSEALCGAVGAGHVQIVQDLLDAGVPIDGESSGGTALMVAALRGRREVAVLLLARGADADKAINGKSAIDIARENEKWDIVELLTSRHRIAGSKDEG